jgi:hypothetical protein
VISTSSALLRPKRNRSSSPGNLALELEDSPRRALTCFSVPAHTRSSPIACRGARKSHATWVTLRNRALSSPGEHGRGSERFAGRTSSCRTKNSLRFGKRRIHPIRNGPGGGPERIIATSSLNAVCFSARRRRSASRPQGPGRTSPSAAMKSCSRRTRCDAMSCAVHGSRSVGACGPSSTNRSQSRRRSIASKSNSATPVDRDDCRSVPRPVSRMNVRTAWMTTHS